MAKFASRFWDTAALAYGQLLPYHRGKERVFERVWPLAEGAWDGPSIVKRDGVWYQLDRRDYVDKYIYYLGFDLDETRFLKRLIKHDWVVADIGANIGYYSLLLSRLVGSRGVVHSFEPATPIYERLEKNLSLNGVNNVLTHKLALANSRGEVSLVLGKPGNSGKTRLGTSDQGSEHITVTTLDAFVEEQVLPRLDFIKVDIEGAECRFLQGADEAIRRFKPAILAELNPSALADFGSTTDELVQRLGGLAYRLFRPRRKGLAAFRGFRRGETYTNVVALPESR